MILLIFKDSSKLGIRVTCRSSWTRCVTFIVLFELHVALHGHVASLSLHYSSYMSLFMDMLRHFRCTIRVTCRSSWTCCVTFIVLFELHVALHGYVASLSLYYSSYMSLFTDMLRHFHSTQSTMKLILNPTHSKRKQSHYRPGQTPRLPRV